MRRFSLEKKVRFAGPYFIIGVSAPRKKKKRPALTRGLLGSAYAPFVGGALDR